MRESSNKRYGSNKQYGSEIENQRDGKQWNSWKFIRR